MEASQEATALSNELYTRGLTAFFNVLESQRTLYAAGDAPVQSDTTIITNLIAFYKALGGGWEGRLVGHCRPQSRPLRLSSETAPFVPRTRLRLLADAGQSARWGVCLFARDFTCPSVNSLPNPGGRAKSARNR